MILINKTYFKFSLLFIIFAELVSVTAFILPDTRATVFFVMAILVAMLSIIDLRWGIFIAVAELFIGSFGNLFWLEIGSTQVSIRISIFLVVMAVWLAKTILKAVKERSITPFLPILPKITGYYMLALAMLIIWGLINGLRANTLENVFFDFNNWLFFLYIFPFSQLLNNQNEVQKLAGIFSAAVVWVSIKSLLLLYLFSHNAIGTLEQTYKWVRDTGVGEITRYAGNFFRVFLQSQIYALMGFFLFLPLIRNQVRTKKLFFSFPPLAFFSLTIVSILISFSRSYWLGFVVVLIAGFIFIKLNANWQTLAKIFLYFFSSLIFALLLISIVIYLPPTDFSGNLGELAVNRALNLGGAAGSSRVNLLEPLKTAITQNPILGAGFGQTITYTSADPRILAGTAGATGEYTTYAFEWGWLDIALKIGLLGFAIYLSLIVNILFNFYKLSKSGKILPLGFLLGLAALVVVHITTPYLNHPLGIGYLILALVSAEKM